MFLTLVFTVLSSCAVFVHGKVMCFEEKTEIDGNLDINVNYKYAADAKNLPPTLGKLNLQGNSIWYFEGSGAGSDIKITADRKLYTNKSKVVQIFIRYYTKSPRSPSIYPVKGNLPLVTLPPSGNDWSEVKYDVDPSGPPVEISLYLSAGQFILFDTIVLSVDNILPRTSPANACQEPPAIGRPAGTSRDSQASGSGSGVSSSSTIPGTLTTITTTPGKTASGQCTVVPPTECKCNCLCNCTKC